jgi:hypothetical protein
VLRSGFGVESAGSCRMGCRCSKGLSFVAPASWHRWEERIRERTPCLEFVAFYTVLANFPYWMATKDLGLLRNRGFFCIEYVAVGLLALVIPPCRFSNRSLSNDVRRSDLRDLRIVFSFDSAMPDKRRDISHVTHLSSVFRRGNRTACVDCGCGWVLFIECGRSGSPAAADSHLSLDVWSPDFRH